MTALVIDTSSRREMAAAIVAADAAVVEAVVGPGDAVAVTLPAALTRLLRMEIGAVVVVAGPGSYTGTRAGMAAAVGVAMVRSLPLHTLGALELAAAPLLELEQPNGTALADAGRGGVYAAPVSRRGGRVVAADPTRLAITATHSLRRPLVGVDALELDGYVRADRITAIASLTAQALATPPVPLERLRAVVVA